MTLKMNNNLKNWWLQSDTVSGKGYMIVTETGIQTELGKIASLLQQGNEEQTPLQKRLHELGLRLVWICLGIVSLVFAFGFLKGTPLIENFLISISLAVAAIPEGLPTIVTIALSIGVHKMAKRNALVRRLPSVETLGCTTVICTDKTGTLTQNEMTVRSIWINNTYIDVTGIGYSPEGNFEINHLTINPQDTTGLLMALKIGILCNSAELHQTHDHLKNWNITGDPTEGALLAVAGKANLFKQDLETEHPLLSEIPFDSERKRMSMVRQTTEGPVLFINGAADIMLTHSQSILLNGKIEPLTIERKKNVIDANAYLASQALRVLAVGYRPIPLLWINLASDGLPAIALGVDPIDQKSMKCSPRKPSDSIISRKKALHLLLISFVIALGTLIACYFGMHQSAELAQTMAFTTLVVLELVAVQIIRSLYNVSVFSNPLIIAAVTLSFLMQLFIVYTPFLQSIFKTIALSTREWGAILAITVVVWILCDLINRSFKWHRGNQK